MPTCFVESPLKETSGYMSEVLNVVLSYFELKQLTLSDQALIKGKPSAKASRSACGVGSSA
jgi:hypothetical protein